MISRLILAIAIITGTVLCASARGADTTFVRPESVPLPETGIVLEVGMTRAQVDSALVIWKPELAGEENGREVYMVDIRTPRSTYTLQTVFKADTLLELSVSTLDGGAVERWFRALADRLPLNTTYEQHTDELDMVTETWTTFEAVWQTEHPVRPDPAGNMTYWEFRRR